MNRPFEPGEVVYRWKEEINSQCLGCPVGTITFITETGPSDWEPEGEPLLGSPIKVDAERYPDPTWMADSYFFRRLTPDDYARLSEKHCKERTE